ncbi:MAG: FAD-dependent oxidoreductase [Bdellovibrionota bacterium]
MVFTKGFSSPIVEVDFAIGGGGIVGLCIARELMTRFPQSQTVVVEKEKYLGEHSSGRNSGVLHAGIYYPNRSKKHLLCLEGNALWNDLAQALDIKLKRCGKFIFSTSTDEDLHLDEIFERSIKNNVPGINYVHGADLQNLRSNVNAHAAIFSPMTGIIDASEALLRLKYSIDSKGGNIDMGSSISDVEYDGRYFLLQTETYIIKTPIFINCLGHGGVTLRKKLGLQNLEAKVVKGNYLSTTQKLNYSSLYYPVPPRDMKGLGVHSTIDFDGRVKFGPDIEDTDTVDYSPSLLSLNQMTSKITEYFKDIKPELLFWDYAGCRSKIFHNNKLYVDFWIESPVPNYIECLGIESPGLTSAPAIAKAVCKLIS